MDVIRVPSSEFERLRPPRIVDGVLFTKIANVLSRYECFNVNDSEKKKRSARATCKQSSDWSRSDQPRSIRADSSVAIRKTMGCVNPALAKIIDALNKITHANYGKILQQVLNSNGKHACESVMACRAILKKSYEEDVFMSVYLKLLHDILQKGSDADRIQIKLDILNFVQGTISLDLETDLQPQAEDTGYDGLCCRLKNKKHLVGRARVTLWLIDEGMVDVSRQMYYQSTLSAIHRFCRGDNYDDDHADIAIDYMREFMQTSSQEQAAKLMDNLSQVYETHVNKWCSLKCKFKMQGFIRTKQSIVQTQQCSLVVKQPSCQHPNLLSCWQHPEEEEIWQTTTKLRQQLRHPLSMAPRQAY